MPNSGNYLLRTILNCDKSRRWRCRLLKVFFILSCVLIAKFYTSSISKQTTSTPDTIASPIAPKEQPIADNPTPQIYKYVDENGTVTFTDTPRQTLH